MADHKKNDRPNRMPSIELVAVERGFYNGRMVEPGKSFMFNPNSKADVNKTLPHPKWAAEPSQAILKKPAPTGYDTKPLDAQVAVKAKAAQFGGSN